MIQPREASYSFDLPTPVTVAEVREALTWLCEQHKANPDYLLVSPGDFQALKREITGGAPLLSAFAILHILNEVAEGLVRLVCAPDMPSGYITFSKLYAKKATQIVESDGVLTIDTEHSALDMVEV